MVNREFLLAAVAENADLPLPAQQYLLSQGQQKALALNTHLDPEILDVLCEETYVDVILNLSTNPQLKDYHINTMMAHQILVIDFFTDNLPNIEEVRKIIFKNTCSVVNMLQHPNVGLTALFTAVNCKEENIASLAFPKYMERM